MALEIERKFLVRNDNFKQDAFRQTRITQGYLNSAPERTVRVRINDDRGFVTVKGKTDDAGISRFEWEQEIPVEDAGRLLALAEPGVIDKVRFFVKNTDGIHTWEVDEFCGDNAGLTVAEIELADSCDTFETPSWLGLEVTGDPRYFNSALAANPYKNW